MTSEPKSFEDAALRFIGSDLYEAFFRGYTLKQWGVHPSDIPASILKRLPVRFNYDDNYFNHPYQGIPRHGYTHVVEKMLACEGIKVRLGCHFQPHHARNYDHVFYSGPLDDWFDRCHGRLPYRTIDLQHDRLCIKDAQGAPVINYCDHEVPWTRTLEFKHFAPWDPAPGGTIVTKEYSRAWEEGDEPFYPIHLTTTSAVLSAYEALAAKESRVTFCGRLGTFRYLDMDVTIAQALEIADRWTA